AETIEDKASQLEEARRTAIDRIRKLTSKQPQHCIAPKYLPEGNLVLPSAATCTWGKKFLEKLAEVYLYASTQELNDWLARTEDERMGHRRATQKGSHTSYNDLAAYLAKCKQEHREGKRQMTQIED
ncbi:hypothetical protein M409DRAFT_29812, partial [Zasmidium cellare ATCC 36951]